jgi:hypothetical protein
VLQLGYKIEIRSVMLDDLRLIMVTINLPATLEQQLWGVIQTDYNGDIQAAMAAFLSLHEKYGWKEQLRKDVASIHTEMRLRGGIKEKTIQDTIKRYRETLDAASR